MPSLRIGRALARSADKAMWSSHVVSVEWKDERGCLNGFLLEGKFEYWSDDEHSNFGRGGRWFMRSWKFAKLHDFIILRTKIARKKPKKVNFLVKISKFRPTTELRRKMDGNFNIFTTNLWYDSSFERGHVSLMKKNKLVSFKTRKWISKFKVPNRGPIWPLSWCLDMVHLLHTVKCNNEMGPFDCKKSLAPEHGFSKPLLTSINITIYDKK